MELGRLYGSICVPSMVIIMMGVVVWPVITTNLLQEILHSLFFCSLSCKDEYYFGDDGVTSKRIRMGASSSSSSTHTCIRLITQVHSTSFLEST